MPTAPPDSLLGQLPANNSSIGPATAQVPLDPRQIPGSLEVRLKIQQQCEKVIIHRGSEPSDSPWSRQELEQGAKTVLKQLQLPEVYLGWTMVALISAFWKRRVAQVPHARRLFLISNSTNTCADSAVVAPNGIAKGSVKSPAKSPADVHLQALAQQLGYQVLVADSSSASLSSTILNHQIEAILGVATLTELEGVLDRILPAEIPCMAVPLLQEAGSPIFRMDDTLVEGMLQIPYEPAEDTKHSYVHLLRSATSLFEPAELARLAMRSPATEPAERSAIEPGKLNPVTGTEALAYDFLVRGGKYSRPFITLAVYDALTGANGTLADGADYLAKLSDSVKRTALSIETFHKASLIHDDIEDDDLYRYGEATLHRRFGIPTAINVGDYLIGLGYRLVSRESHSLGPEVVADILDYLADAHMKLTQGQGAELLWRDSLDKQLTPADALNIYALKTAPAFEAAMYAGLRLAGPIDSYIEPIAKFATSLGIAFQILNDLGDWEGDDHNKLVPAGDILGGRPTVLWALALQSLADPVQRQELEGLMARAAQQPDELQKIKCLYQEHGVFTQAAELINLHRDLAEAAVTEIDPPELQRLLRYLIASVLTPGAGAFVAAAT